MASGSPSSRRQISATAGAFSLSMAKSGLTACARSMKRRTASYWESCSSVVGGLRRGRPRGGTGYSRSARSRSGTRLVASTFSPGDGPSSSPTAGAASTRCSKLSRTRSSCLAARKSRRRSASGRSPSSRMPSAVAIAEGTSSGSVSAASGTKKTPSGKSSSSSAAACSASRVLPVPRARSGQELHLRPPQQTRRSLPPPAPDRGRASAAGAGCWAGPPAT